MKKTIENLMSQMPGETAENGRFFRVKGGKSLLMVSQNKACSNTGDTCSGNNIGDCTNSFNTDCSGGTNTGDCDDGRCFPL